MRVNVSRCDRCLCKYCTKYNCQYSRDRCWSCYTIDKGALLDCDYFEHKRTTHKRYKIGKKINHEKSDLSAKLDLLLKNFGIQFEPPQAYGTFYVLHNSMIIQIFNTRADAEQYVSRNAGQLGNLIIKKGKVSF